MKNKIDNLALTLSLCIFCFLAWNFFTGKPQVVSMLRVRVDNVSAKHDVRASSHYLNQHEVKNELSDEVSFEHPIPKPMRNLAGVLFEPLASSRDDLSSREFKKVYLYKPSVDENPLRIEMFYEKTDGAIKFKERKMMTGNEIMVRLKNPTSPEEFNIWAQKSGYSTITNIPGKEYKIIVPDGDMLHTYDKMLEELSQVQIFEDVFPNWIVVSN